MKIDFYNLKLDVNFDKAEVEGKERIRLREAGRKVELDAVDVEIEEVYANGSKCSFTHKKEEGRLEINFERDIETVDIDIVYKKKAEEKAIFGFFMSRYNGKYMLVTDFEPDGARSFLPCKDDPSYKASFRVEVRTRRDKKVISNMPVEFVEYDGEKARYCFQPTPPMSTYLLFVGIGDFNEFTFRKKGIDFIAASRFEQIER